MAVNTPTLSLIAGPNGSGKTYFSDYLIEQGIITTKPVNLDFIDVNVYNKLSGNVYNYNAQISKIKHQFFIKSCEEAIAENQDFAYESNLRMSQIKPVALFEAANYNLNLNFFYMPSVKRCKERVRTRVKNGGMMLIM
ncbi:zeta toxin family protein [Algibacter sp. 2305UL17-15]|uniref:zeta toxin family protein n=1 Tax=Algibacter sp. 2305UL17-15 TaxID=3231268 RepID=UPI003457E939